MLEGDLDAVLAEITDEVARSRPGFVVVDSFRSVIRTRQGIANYEAELQAFLQRLALRLTSWEVTSFLIGEYAGEEVRENPVFTVADGIFWFSQAVEQNSVVRKLQVIKSRGQAPIPGLHTFRITADGVSVFPRTAHGDMSERRPSADRRLSLADPVLDEMLGGGIPAGDSVLVAGPAGSGKTVLGSQFIAAGLAAGEPGIIACFEEHPDVYVQRAAKLGVELRPYIEDGTLRMFFLPLIDLSVDEALQAIRDAVNELGEARVVIDSLSGFEVALAPSFRDEFRESLYRMLAALAHRGATVMMTVEVSDDYTKLRFSPHAVSFLIDDLIIQRYIELEGRIRRVMTVVKMRGSEHPTAWRTYDVEQGGIQVGEVLEQYRGIMTGVPVPRESPSPVFHSRLTRSEVTVLNAVTETGGGAVESIVQRAELDAATVDAALERLVLLGYLRASEHDGRIDYEAPGESFG